MEPRRHLNEEATAIIAKTFQTSDSDPEPRAMSESIARGTTIIGKILEGISDENHKSGHRYATWLANLGVLSWNIVELSVPHSLGEVFLRYWLKLATVLAVLIIILGILTDGNRIELQTGGILLGIVVIVATIQTWLRRLMLHKPAPRWLRFLASGLLILGSVCVLYLIFDGLRLEFEQRATQVRSVIASATSKIHNHPK